MVNQLPSKRFQLVTLGQLALVDGAGTPEPTLGRRPRKLALLAVLALERKPMSRDQLADLFWGNRDEARAKHSLSDAVSHLRQVLGSSALEISRNTVAITAHASLDVDALTLRDAARAGDHESVIANYGGPFFAGVHVEASPSFEHWVDRRRSEYERVFIQSCQRLLDSRVATQPAAALEIAERWLHVEPMSETAALAMLRAHASQGRDGSVRALRAFENLERRLREELDFAPPASVVKAAQELRMQLQDSIAVVPASPPGIMEDSGRPVARVARWRPGLVTAIGLAAAVAGVLVSFTARATGHAGAGVIILPFARPPGWPTDSSTQWLGDGAARLLAAKLSRADVDAVVWTTSTRDTVAATRRLGARWLISGFVTRHDSLASLQVVLRDPASGAIVRRFTVAERDLIAAADAAGVQILSGLSWQTTGPALRGIETHSVAAYRHYVQALRASSESDAAAFIHNLDAAIALDSGFMSAVSERARHARVTGEHEVMQRLVPLFQRFAYRLGEWDRLELALHAARNRPDASEAEAAARELLRQFPRDPRAYGLAMHALAGYGKWTGADSVIRAADQLGSTTGNTLCDPCADFGWWVEYRLMRGDHAGADSIARAFIERYPDRRGGWQLLARALARSRRYDEALATAQRARAFAARNLDIDVDVVRVLVASRRLREAESIVSRIRGGRDTAIALELQMLVERERGQFTRAARTAEALARHPGFEWAVLVGANSLARAGQYEQAAALYERVGGHIADWRLDRAAPFLHGTASAARTFAWHHALQADAIAPRCEVARLAALADSIRVVGAMSNYSRDWTLHHYVRGIVGACEGRDGDAVTSFEAAQYTPFLGWTVVNLALANGQIRLGRPALALAWLRPAYYSLPEGMGWYVTRAELDLAMAEAFQALGVQDSATTYLAYVQRAWVDADARQRAMVARAGLSRVAARRPAL